MVALPMFCYLALLLATGVPASPRVFSTWKDPYIQPFEAKTATFALGCFWDFEARFGCLDGVLSTSAGYSGGKKENPDYSHTLDHVECVQVKYNPAILTYADLVDVFWKGVGSSVKAAIGPHVGKQYRSIIFYSTAEEKRIATSSRDEMVSQRGIPVSKVKVMRETTFYQAEPEHQKFQLQLNQQLMGYLAFHPNISDSLLGTRLNAYAANLCPADMRTQIEKTLRNLEKKLSSLQTSAEMMMMS